MIAVTQNVNDLFRPGRAWPLMIRVEAGVPALPALHIGSGMIVAHDGIALPVIDGMTAPRSFCEFKASRVRPMLADPPKPEATMTDCVFVAGSRAFYHFMVTTFPQLAFLNSMPERERMALLNLSAPPDGFERVLASLMPGLAGGRPVDVLTVPDGVYAVENVVVPMLPTIAAGVAFHRKVVRPALLTDTVAECDRTPVKLFVRRAAPTRRLRNEPAVAEWLAARGFMAVDPGALPLAEQAALFARATHIVGVEGAALTNLVYADAGTRVTVLVNRIAGLENFFSIIAAKCGHAYCQIEGRFAADAAFERKSDFVVDLAQLERLDPAFLG
jgi:hypothetical protein